MQIEISIDGGPSRVVTFERGRLKLKTLRLLEQAQRNPSWEILIPAVAGMLGLTPEEADEITLDQWESITAAMRESASAVAAVPPESAPPSE